MRIGFIAVNDKPTSALSPGGTEVFVTALAERLSERGHEIVLFASGDSYVNGVELIKTTKHSLLQIQKELKDNENVELNYWDREIISNQLNLRNVYSAKMHEHQIDIFHENMSSPIIGTILDIFNKPIVSTLHMPVPEFINYQSVPKVYDNPNNIFVAISKYQQQQYPDSSHHIYNGIDIRLYAPDQLTNQQDLIWIGRIDPGTPKGLDDAIFAAKETKHHLSYVGFVEEKNYYATQIEPLLDSTIRHHKQFSSLEEKVSFYRNGKAALIPIQWEEPFGLTFIESMAAGTPVITYARGAAPELIKDGETGFLINSSDNDIRGDWTIKETGVKGLCEAVNRIYAMSEDRYSQMRRACRKHVEDHFTIDQMVDNYEKLYMDILGL